MNNFFKQCVLLNLLLVFSIHSYAGEYSDKRLIKYISSKAKVMKQNESSLVFFHKDVPMFSVWDMRYDRMRIFSYIKKTSELKSNEQENMLNANFHKSLDARYAISDGKVYAIYLHPLSSLDDAQLSSAMDQVANLAISFGQSYSSGKLVYKPAQKDGTKKKPHNTAGSEGRIR